MIRVELTDDQARETLNALDGHLHAIAKLRTSTKLARSAQLDQLEHVADAILRIASALNASTKVDILPKSAD